MPRLARVAVPAAGDPPAGEQPLGRRGFLASGIGLAAGLAGGAAAGAGVAKTGARLDRADAAYPVRPPGSVPERQFLQMCIRCGECFQACPNNVLQPQPFDQGIEGLWTPRVEANWSGYAAIEFVRAGTQADAEGNPVEGSGTLAPVVLTEKCIGCGLCQTRCYAINVKTKKLLEAIAIQVAAGPGKDDRIKSGSYRQLRAEEQRRRQAKHRSGDLPSGDTYLPDFLR